MTILPYSCGKVSQQMKYLYLFFYTGSNLVFPLPNRPKCYLFLDASECRMDPESMHFECCKYLDNFGNKNENIFSKFKLLGIRSMLNL